MTRARLLSSGFFAALRMTREGIMARRDRLDSVRGALSGPGRGGGDEVGRADLRGPRSGRESVLPRGAAGTGGRVGRGRDPGSGGPAALRLRDVAGKRGGVAGPGPAEAARCRRALPPALPRERDRGRGGPQARARARGESRRGSPRGQPAGDADARRPGPGGAPPSGRGGRTEHPEDPGSGALEPRTHRAGHRRRDRGHRSRMDASGPSDSVPRLERVGRNARLQLARRGP